jgi:hypothetical protein
LKKRFSNFIVRITSLLCVGAAVFWIRSLWRSDLVLLQRMQQPGTPSWVKVHNEIWFASASGTFSLGWSSWQDSLPHARAMWRRIVQSQPTATWNDLQLHATWRGNRFGTLWISSLYVPYPLIMLALSLPWVWQWMRERRQKRVTALNLCPRCGYDLRASPERCPECGLAVDKR